MILTKSDIKKSLEGADCPIELINNIERDIGLWWKSGWIQEILEAQEQATLKAIGEWLDNHIMAALLKADMQGYEFKAVLQFLKAGKMPEVEE